MTSLEILLSFLCIFLFVLLLLPGVRYSIESIIQKKYPFVLVIYIISGICLYILGYNCIDPEKNKWLYTIVIKLADLLVLGVFLGIITNTPRFLNIFRESLTNELYSEHHLRQRRDIRDIWDKVSKSMFKDKYPDISSSILSIIRDYYFPKSDQGYYDHYSVQHDVSFIDPDKKYIKSVESISFIYKSFDASKLFEQNISCHKKNEADSTINIRVNSFKIDDIESLAKLKQNAQTENGILKVDLSMKLPKSKDGEYKIEIQQEKVYLLEDDFDITFSSRRIASNVNVELRYTDDFYVYFQDFGNVTGYVVTNQRGIIRAQNKGVILPKQGYSFHLRKN